MKKFLLAVLAGLAITACASAQGSGSVNFAMEKADQSVEKNGSTVIQAVTYSDTAAQNAFFGGPVGSSGAPTFRLFADGDNVILGQGATPGTQQAVNANFNVAGKGIAANFEVPSAGKYCGTALACWTMTSTDGRIVGQTNAGNNTFTLGLGGNASTNALLNTSTTETSLATIGGNPWPFRMTQWRNGTSADTSAAITLSTTATYSGSYRACDTTANVVAYTLPTAANTGTYFFIKHVAGDTNACTITRASSDLIDGLTVVTLANIGDWVLIHDSSNSNLAWQIVAGNQFGAASATSAAEHCTANQTTRAGAQMLNCSMTELLTLSTGGLTTQTTANLLPANSIIDAVAVRVTTTITTATDWAVGDSTSTSRFCSANATKTAGTTSVCMNQWNGALATTLALSPSQAAAAKVQITVTGANPGAGAIRITSYYRRYVAPTS